ncbi:hypothetical protein PSEUBRA_001407 [Kalmanozyma brasiliensis GHG001]|uniref:uncharacterized protein n=1 Tax=Kalmanozyma brasiliensis (strain GHG001) TaxID=1365824 RepID=UPI0028680CBA|nr:uncharacterized protein PSEUBRA_001407 [Kalmanozyma brasiliensis GHG001]KAF6766935.1 hypothetical protein PSEUBRA_001407 [Kalmanozyma brasiliensis GHG001]
MTTLEMPRPRRPTASSVRRLSAAQPLTPASPTVIRTPDFILFPSVPTHEPEDNLPTPLAWQQQFAAVALNDAHARRSRNNSIQRSPSSEDWRLPGSSRSDFSHHSSSGGSNSHNTVLHEDNDELEEIADPENEVDGDPAASYDAVRDVRNQQLDSLQSVVHSIAEFHFDRASSSSSSGPDSDITETLDDMFASIRRIGGHNAPLSPTFARPMMASPNMHQLSDVDRLVLLVDRLKASVGGITDAHQAGLLAKLIKLTQGLIESERRIAHPAAAALESPPRTPRSVLATSRRRSFIHAVQHSPRSSSQLSLSRGSFSSTQSYNTLPTSSDEAGHNSDAELQHRRARSKSLSAAAAAASSPATKFTKPLDALAEVAPLSAVPEQHQFDGSVFDMATVRQSPKPPARDAPFSFETLYSPLSTALGLINTHSSPRSDQASLAASVAAKSDATALPGRSRRSRSVSVQTDDNKSVASTCLPGYNSHEAPGYEVADASSTSKNLEKQSQAGDLPQYAESTAAAASASLSSDVKKPVEAPTLLERRRAKMAAQHSAYAARTPEDLAVVQSSIDHMSTVMPQLDNQRALSPEEQREAQLQTMMGRLSKSSSTRMNDQRSNPPTLRATRTAPSPPLASTTAQTGLLTPLVAVNELPPRRESTFVPEREAPKTPTTPPFVSNASSSRRASLLPSAFTRKLSIASIGNALRRASIYDASKAKQQQQQQPPPKAVERRQQSESEVSAPTIVVDDATVRHRRGQASRDTRTKYDIAESLTTLINDGKAPNKSSPVSSIRSSRASKRESQGFRAIDFADDTPRGRDTVMARDGIEMEDEDDSMLQDYSFAKVTTTKSNHRLSIMPIVPDSPRSLADWGSSASSRRSSNHGSASPGTPTWPKSPLTPVSPTMPTAKRISMKPSVTFAAGTLPPPPAGQSVAANNSIL